MKRIRAWLRRIPPWMMSFLAPPNPDDDLICLQQEAWVESYQPKNGVHGAFVLEHARRVYEEFSSSLETLDAKALDLLRTSGALATILVATVAGFKIAPIWAVPSLFFFLATAGIAVLSRRALARHSQATIRSVVEDSPQTGNDHEAWLAVSLHRTTEQMRVLQEWKARRVNWASWSLCLGLLALFVVLLSLGAKEP